MVCFKGQKKLSPHPDQCPFGVESKYPTSIPAAFICEPPPPTPLSHWGGVLRVIYRYIRVKYEQHRYITLIHRFRVVNHRISHESLLFSWYTHEPNLKEEKIYFYKRSLIRESVSLRTQTYFRLSLVPPKITSANSSQKLISVTSKLLFCC